MILLTVDEDVAALLGGYVDAVEVRDAQGRVMGHFLPYLTPAARDFYAHPETYFDLEEAKRVLAEERHEGLPLAEVWKRIRAGKTGMKYTVVWLPRAESRLTHLWINAPDQQAVADASDRIDVQLAVDADHLGNPLGIFRTYEDAPLAVLFHVDPGDCMVRVIQVRQTN